VGRGTVVRRDRKHVRWEKQL
jgi:hypothetical protein